MKTKEIVLVSLLTAFLGGCNSMEESVINNQEEAIRLTAGIGETTRAVIDAGYANSLDVSFARIDNPTTSSTWNTPSIDAVRAGGAGNTSVTFSPEQNYLAENGKSALIGYYPRKALDSGTDNPVSVSYTITGDEDIMATEIKVGALDNKFTAFTFQHLLTQLQFKCIGSAEAIKKWTGITSLTVKNVPTALKLSLDKTAGATLTATGASNQNLAVKNCPTTVSSVTEQSPRIGYLMLFPTANWGTEIVPVNLEVKATYEGTGKTLSVDVKNITNGVKAGQSHLITLTFTEDGRISAEAGIAEWVSGNNGSSVVTPS